MRTRKPAGSVDDNQAEVFARAVKARTIKFASAVDLADAISEYEAGELDEDATIALFQNLVDTGIAWTLQGSYGRTAMALIRAGRVTPPTRAK